MAVETELKLSVLPQELPKLKADPWLRSISIGRASSRKLYSVYFDTPELALQQHRMALRLRRVGKQWIQTMKGGGQVQAGLHSRNEWESVVASDELDWHALTQSGGRLPHGVHKQSLLPVFVTDFSRSSRLVIFRGATIEIGIDEGEIRAGEKSHPVAELELELKSGHAQQLFQLALLLSARYSLQIESISKAQYGYGLWYGSIPSVLAQEVNPDIRPTGQVVDILQAVAWSAMQQFQTNLVGAKKNEDAEYLHQMRIALRQLRIALKIAKKILPNNELDQLHKAFSGLAKALGCVRNWDVFMTQIAPAIPHAAGGPLISSGERTRLEHVAHLRDILNSRELEQLPLWFGAWMHGGYWAAMGKHSAASDHYIKQRLEKYHHKIQAAKHEGMLVQPAALHAFRVTCKKMRYTVAMFDSRFHQSKFRPYLSALIEAQDLSGKMNDFSVSHDLIEQITPKLNEEEIVRVQGWLAQQRSALLPAMKKALTRLVNQDVFWR